MEIAEYKNIFVHEETHFFYVANHRIVLSFLQKYIAISSKRKSLTILDAGCGTGLLATKLMKFGKVIGIDIHPQAIEFSKKRGVIAKKANIMNMPFPNNTFDVVVCIDVLYHKKVHDDTKALTEFFRVLKPNGILIIRAPAHPWIKSAHDTYVHLGHRYRKEELQDKLVDSGFAIEKLSYINSFLLIPAIIRHVLDRLHSSKQPSSSITRIPKFINRIFSHILSSEMYILDKMVVPFGLGLIAVGRKPTSKTKHRLSLN